MTSRTGELAQPPEPGRREAIRHARIRLASWFRAASLNPAEHLAG